MWYQKFNTYIQGLGFVRSNVDHYVYYKQVGNDFIYVVLYVDDMLLVGNNMDVIKEVKMQLYSKFDMKDLNVASLILGMEIKRNHKAICRTESQDSGRRRRHVSCSLC